jgi:hypothetical protein
MSKAFTVMVGCKTRTFPEYSEAEKWAQSEANILRTVVTIQYEVDNGWVNTMVHPQGAKKCTS